MRMSRDNPRKLRFKLIFVFVFKREKTIRKKTSIILFLKKLFRSFGGIVFQVVFSLMAGYNNNC